jgi:uncharacterized protein
MHELTPLSALIGGVLIGLASSLLLLASGRVAGISGIFGGLLLGKPGDRAWRTAFLFGLLAAGLSFAWLQPGALGASPRGLGALAVAGLLVGVGTRLGNGCTSGHGVCGISRGSRRSLLATLTFVGTGILTATLVRLLGGAV